MPALLAVAVATAMLLPGTAPAQTGGGPQSGGQAALNGLTEASTEEIQALAALQATQQQAATLNGRVSALQAELAASQAALAPLQARVDELTAQEHAAEQALADAKARLNASAASILITDSQSQGYDSVGAASPADLVTAEHDLSNLAQQRTNLVGRVLSLRASITTKQAAAEALAQPVRDARDRVGSLLAQLQPAEDQAAQAQAAAQAQLNTIRGKKNQFELELSWLQGASDSIATLLRARGIGPGTVGACDVRPVPGPVISPFGPRIDPITGAQGFHTGVDLQATYGTPIRACRDGAVVIASLQGGYGNAVVIDHGGGMATLYAHQSLVAVKPDQFVHAGDVIGYVGSTGYSTGPHLHFEVRLLGNPVNPASFLP